MDTQLPDGFILDAAEQSLPGIESIFQITPFGSGLLPENDLTKLIRISEYITHRNRAVTARDYERMALQAFPQLGKVKCLCRSGIVTLVVIPLDKKKGLHYRPYTCAELLLEIESCFSGKTSPFVREINAVNPVYEEILVRCAVEFQLTEHSKAHLRAILRKILNQTIAPWQHRGSLPELGYSFTLQQVYDRISTLDFVKEITHLSVVQLLHADDKNNYNFREYNELKDIVSPSSPVSILVPFRHHILAPEINGEFGIEEMGIHEHFVIWQNETEKH